MLPLVSIIIPVYNGGNFLRQAINSALSQTYNNIEVIVINDGSKDDGETERIALSYGSLIRYFAKENGGVASALNYGISCMKGEYFSWLSHDDMYTPDKIETQIKQIIGANQQIGCCNVSIVAEDGKLIRHNYMAERKYKSIKCFMALDTDTGINGCALLIPRQAFEECGYFKEELKCTQDYDMWFRMAEKYVFVFSEKQMVLSRQHPAQDSRTKTDLCTEEADVLHSKILNSVAIEELERFEKNNAYYLKQYHIYYNAGYKKTAAQILTKLLILYKKNNRHYSYRNLLQKEVIMLDEDLKVDSFVECIDNYKKDKEHTILFYSNVWTHGGIERVLSNIMPGLIHKYNIILISNDVGDEYSFSIPGQVLHLKVGKQLDERLPFSLLALCILLKVDLFVGNPNIIVPFLDVYKMMEDSGIRTIACNHGNYFIPCWTEGLYPIMAKRRSVYPEVSAVTWLTSFSKYLGDTISDNGYLLPNPNTYEKQSEITQQIRDKTIVCVGRFYDSIKRVDRALKVFRKVLEHHPDAKLQLIGGLSLDMILPSDALSVGELIKQLDFPDENSIELIGEAEDMVPYYKSASLQILVSQSEGFPMVLNEGAVFGCPSIIFEIPGLEDVIENGKNGYILPQGDIEGMSNKISELLDKPELLMSIRNNAVKYAERFAKNIIIKKWDTLFEIVLRTNGRRERAEAFRKIEAVITREREDELFNAAILHYQQEINNLRNIINAKCPAKLDEKLDESSQIEVELLKSEGLTYKEILEQLENQLIYLMELTKGETQIKYVLEQLPLNNSQKTIGIYGTGVHTNKMLSAYEQMVGKINAKLIFIDTNKASFSEKYKGYDIYNVKDIGTLEMYDIILSSNLYEDEMYKIIKEYYGDRYNIYRFYENSKQRLFN